MRTIILFILSLVLASIVPLFPMKNESRGTILFPGWPDEYQSKTFKESSLSDQEKRFEKKFPGRLGRFRKEKLEIVIRWVYEPTRKLHPAADCYKGSGYKIGNQPIWIDKDNLRWGVFTATKNKTSITVKERIYDSQGNSWTDVSSWYWAAILGNSKGPWWAVTIAWGILYP